MFTVESYDPFFFDRVRREQPRLHPNHIGLVRLAHSASMQDLEGLDRELEVLTARRRAVLGRLRDYRTRLWPGMRGRHHRKTCRLEDEPMPPAALDAVPLWGGDLRRVMTAIVRRHGDVTLRELHGLIHCYGYTVDSVRPVQRLADAAAFEVRHGRMERIDRGVYGPGPAADLDTITALPAEPNEWAPPEAAAGEGHHDSAVDPTVALDPERWSASAWPASAQLGGDWCAGEPDPFVRDLAEDLDRTVAAARDRLATTLVDRLGPQPPQYDPHPGHGPTGGPTRDPVRRPTRRPPSGPAQKPLGDDSSTNRPPTSAEGAPDVEGGGEGGAGEPPPGPAPDSAPE